MFRKLMVASSPTRRLGLPITQALKFGEISPMTTEAIFGRSDAFCTSWRV